LLESAKVLYNGRRQADAVRAIDFGCDRSYFFFQADRFGIERPEGAIPGGQRNQRLGQFEPTGAAWL
jgi:hypothetical protein